MIDILNQISPCYRESGVSLLIYLTFGVLSVFESFCTSASDFVLLLFNFTFH